MDCGKPRESEFKSPLAHHSFGDRPPRPWKGITVQLGAAVAMDAAATSSGAAAAGSWTWPHSLRLRRSVGTAGATRFAASMTRAVLGSGRCVPCRTIMVICRRRCRPRGGMRGPDRGATWRVAVDQRDVSWCRPASGPNEVRRRGGRQCRSGPQPRRHLAGRPARSARGCAAVTATKHPAVLQVAASPCGSCRTGGNGLSLDDLAAVAPSTVTTAKAVTVADIASRRQ